MNPSEPDDFRRRVDDVINRFLDGQLAFEPAIRELTPLFRSWFERQDTEEERAADIEAWGSDRPTFIARDYFRIAKGRSEEERRRAMDLVRTIVTRGLANGAA